MIDPIMLYKYIYNKYPNDYENVINRLIYDIKLYFIDFDKLSNVDVFNFYQEIYLSGEFSQNEIFKKYDFSMNIKNFSDEDFMYIKETYIYELSAGREVFINDIKKKQKGIG
ncbi:MAG: hypothetical protein RSD85_03750 [Erysipelotrichaceae bacterium]